MSTTREVCCYHLQGTCKHTAATCKYAHDDQGQPCQYGVTCWVKHLTRPPPAVVWQCLLPGSVWTSYTPGDCRLIDEHYARGVPHLRTDALSISTHSHTVYIIDYARMVQLNTQTNVERQIRRTGPPMPTTATGPPGGVPITATSAALHAKRKTEGVPTPSAIDLHVPKTAYLDSQYCACFHDLPPCRLSRSLKPPCLRVTHTR